MIDAIVAGHLCLDIIPEISDLATAASESFLAPGRLTEVGGATVTPGGAVSNAGLALRKLGLDVRLLARLGDDAIGRLTRDILSARGSRLTERLGTAVGEPSSYTVVISPPGIDRTFLHCPGTNNTFGPEDLAIDLLDESRLMHFGYPPLMRRMYSGGGAELAEVFRIAKAHGVTTTLDMSMPDPTKPSGQAPWPEILRAALPLVDVFLPSVEELLFMLRRNRYDELWQRVGPVGMIDALMPDELSALAAEVLALGPHVLVLKLGHRGIYVRSGAGAAPMGRGGPADPRNWRNRELWAPCFLVQVYNTVGSGDSTIGGFLAGLLKGQSIEQTSTSAVAVGACNVEAADSVSGVRTWEETQARVQRGWARLSAHVEGQGWCWNESMGLWHGPGDR